MFNRKQFRRKLLKYLSICVALDRFAILAIQWFGSCFVFLKMVGVAPII